MTVPHPICTATWQRTADVHGTWIRVWRWVVPFDRRLLCAYRVDGLEIYAWHGVDVPPAVITHPAQITPSMIKDERNSEVRRVMIERYGGLARYAMDGGWTLVDEIPANNSQVGLRTAKLWQGDQEDDFAEDGHPLPSMYLDLLNSTPEPDGTTKRYMLRVDPAAYGGDAARYVQAAAASTWRNFDGTLTYPDWRDYAPVAES